MKWSAVCWTRPRAPAGDPVFTAWARLAVTPVREIKRLVDPRDRDGRGRGGRGGPRRVAAVAAVAAATGRGATAAAGSGYAGAEDMRQHGRDGLQARIRIVDMSKGRRGRDEGEKKKGEAVTASTAWATY